MAVNKISLVTPTGDRPAGFALVERWMARQRFDGDVQWIVVDDGRMPTPLTAGQEYIRRDRANDKVRQTLCLNLRAALPLVKYEHLLVLEDDDWYPTSYLDDMAAILDGPYDMVGIGGTKKYHLAFKRWFVDPNTKHAGLFTTGLNARGIEALVGLVTAHEENDFLDLDLWEVPVAKHMVTIDPRPVAIKGMRERDGISIGHDYCSWFADDPDGEVYRSWLGEDSFAYEPWLGTEVAPPSGDTTADEILQPLVKYANVVRRTLGLELRVSSLAQPARTIPRALVRPILAAIQEYVFTAAAAHGGTLTVGFHESGVAAFQVSVAAALSTVEVVPSARLAQWLATIEHNAAQAGVMGRTELHRRPAQLTIAIGRS